MRFKHSFVVIAALLAAVALAGCAATVTALKHKDLEVQTKMSETIFLDPVSPEKRTVWIEVKNTSDQEVDLSPLIGLVTAKGYRVVSDPESAQYVLQVNCLFIGKASQAAIDQSVGVGYGGPLVGILAGAGAGAAIGRDPLGVGVGAVVGGVLGGAAEAVAGALVKVVTYTVVTDVQISERSAMPVAQQQYGTFTQGTQTQVQQQVAETTTWKKYRNRVASTATQVNLDLKDAKPVLVDRLLKSLAGLL